jgi:hypothetical protein
MNAEDKRAQRLQWQEDHIGRALRDSEKNGELRLERLRVSGSL